MRALVGLGLRLAWGTPGQRGRSLLVTASTAVAATAILATLQVTAARVDSTHASATDMARLVAAIVGAVCLPALALAGTVARLSAAVRDRRLANLRLLGLSASQTRLVAVVEAGFAAAAGTAVGVATFVAARSLLPAPYPVAGDSGGARDLVSLPVAEAIVLVALPLVTVLVGVLPVRLDPRRALDRARRRDARRPSVLRLLPILVGIVLCVVLRRSVGAQVSGGEILLLFAGVGLTGLGLVLVVPVFVRLLGDLLLRLGRGPVALVTARRLQAQPAGVTRVVATLMVGLFLVVGARSVLVAFESTPQYVGARDALIRQQQVSFTTRAARTEAVVTRIRALDGVRRVDAVPMLSGQCGPTVDDLCRVVVADCAQLRRMTPHSSGCRPGRLQWLHGPLTAQRLQVWRTTNEQKAGRALGLTVPTSTVRQGTTDELDAAVLVPPDWPGVAALVIGSDRLGVVAADPGRGLVDELVAVGVQPQSFWDFSDHDYVEGLRTVIWSVAAVVLGLGLLTFAVAGVDRAIARRRELTALQLVGVSPGVLLRAQWLEALLPTSLGCVLAIVAGLFAGSTYLAIGDLSSAVPWAAARDLTLVSLVASLLVASLTALGSRVRISADLIRAE